MLEPPDCPEVNEITWGDARSASDHYRRCKDKAEQKIEDLGSTIRGRWDWMREERERIIEDNERLRQSRGNK